MQRPALPTAIRYAGWVVTAASLYYIGRIVLESPPRLADATPATLGQAAAVCVAYAVFPFISAYTWKLAVELVSRRPMSFEQAFGVYVTTNVAKYLPGNVLQYVGRNYAGARHGWSHRELALGTLVELGAIVAVPLALLAALFVAGLWTLPDGLVLDAGRLPGAAALGIAAALVVLVVAILASRGARIVAGFEEWRREGAAMASAARTGAFAGKVALLSLAGFLGTTALFYAIALQLVGLPLRAADFFSVGCALTLAGYAGILTPGVPGGIGVRESASVILLAAYGYDPAGVVAATLLARIGSIAGDVIALAGTFAFGRRRRPER